MSLLEICDQHPPVVSPETSVADTIRLMVQENVGAVTVVDAERVVAGIFTERDVLSRLALSGRDPGKIPVRELMTTPVEMATEETSDAEALSVMLVRHYRHLPIVDSAGRLLGMVSIRHVLQARIDKLTRQLEAHKAR
jgi:CBS domain-containing protein